uniref:Capping protein inhibiting regulator of actin dynamics n=1 Tax=Neogobius melanostomus TaxID=47308 RepID=A0A8C6UG15_9GOBI
MRRSEGDEGSTDEEELPRSPMKVHVQAQVQAQAEAEPPKPELKPIPPAAPHGSPPAKSPRSRRVLPPTGTIESINLDALPQSGPRLDNAAAKHKLSVKPKNQRVSRKHRRFTQDLEELSIPGEEDFDAPCFSADIQRRASACEPLQSNESIRRRQHEEEVKKRREEEERKRAEELRMRELEEERRRREEEERLQREAEERSAREELLRREREEEERRRAEEERKRREEEERRKREEEEEAAARRLQQELLEKRLREEEEARKRKEEEERKRREEEEAKRKKEEEERRKQREEEKARKEREEEQRWKEMEERQKPFSFKVSSGEKQILFQKVNLTPVTPGSTHHQGGAVTDHKESAKVASSEDSSNLSPSTYIPHTAILVTGAQLCGPAVNLDQIKDTACKSLLGLEEKKTPGIPAKTKTSPDRKSGKTKSLSEASFSTDSTGADVLAEWASIRSKIFKGVEDGNYPDPEMAKCQPLSEEQPAFSHTHLRKTMSAIAKFSITPAKKKFGDSNRNSEVYSPEDLGETSPRYEPPVSPAPKPKSKSVRIVERVSDECVFAKDLPSFLVPGAKPESEMLKTRAYSESYDRTDLGEDVIQEGEDAPSPFGIKLRRTNFSLRFHNEESTEKRKKRYSDGDSFDGVPSPLTPIEPDSDVSSVFSERLISPSSPQKEGAACKYIHSPRAKPAKSPSPIPHVESEKVISVHRRPATSPKPSGSVSTPPPSPLPKAHHGTHGQREGAVEAASHEQTKGRGDETTRGGQGHSQGSIQGEEEPKEKKSFFPSINIPWREKTDRKTELIKKEKPSLQSRHSLDSAKVHEKEAPMWIHLALQKQKGFREQQHNREERRTQRESKLAEKQSKERDSVCSRSGSTSPSSKPQTPEEPRRPDSLLGRLERREQLKKANTLPSSVTVEIADSTPSPPAVKDVTKRFPSSDSAQVSTEPAWLALAKRKAKAWSDCPQIIK